MGEENRRGEVMAENKKNSRQVGERLGLNVSGKLTEDSLMSQRVYCGLLQRNQRTRTEVLKMHGRLPGPSWEALQH